MAFRRRGRIRRRNTGFRRSPRRGRIRRRPTRALRIGYRM